MWLKRRSRRGRDCKLESRIPPRGLASMEAAQNQGKRNLFLEYDYYVETYHGMSLYYSQRG